MLMKNEEVRAGVVAMSSDTLSPVSAGSQLPLIVHLGLSFTCRLTTQAKRCVVFELLAQDA